MKKRKGTLSNAIEAVSTMDIVDAFDVPYRIRNGKTYLLCPGHDDRHFGSCYIDKNDDGYYCYACSEHVSKWQMVLKLNGNNRSEAAEWFFKTAGITPVVENSADPYKKAVKLIRKMEKHVCNTPIYNDLKACEKIDSSYGRNINGEYLYSELSITNPLIDIYKRDKQSFKDIAYQLLDVKIAKLSKTKRYYESNCNDGIFVENAGLVTYGEMAEVCQTMIDEVQDLMQEINSI